MTASGRQIARSWRMPLPLVRERLKPFQRPATRLVYPALIVFGAFLFYAPAVLTGRISMPLDTLGFSYPWSEQATNIYPQGQHVPLNGLIQDNLTLTVPWFTFAWRELHAGRLPVWNPYQLGGMPFLANDESAVFYPLQLVAFLLPVDIGLEGLLILVTLTVGLGMYLYLRAIGVPRAAACVGGIVFMLSGFFVVWQGYPQSSTAALLPWVLLGCEGVLQRRVRARRWVALLALAVGICLLAGHIQVGVQVMLATVVYCACRLSGQYWARRGQPAALPQLLNTTKNLILAGTLGVGLAAAQLLPTAQYLAASFTFAFRNQSPSERPQPLANLASWLVPNISGNNAYTRFFPYQQDLNGTYFNYNERTAYVGIAVLALALIAFNHPRARFRQFARVLLALLAVAGAIAYGFPPAYRLAVHFPVFHSINYNRMIFIVAFGLAGLGAIGFDALVRTSGSPRRMGVRWHDAPILIGVVLCGIMGLLVVSAATISTDQITQLINAIGGEPSEPYGTVPAWVRAWTLWAFLLLLLSLVVIGCMLARKVDRFLGGLALALLIGADLLVIADHYAPYNPPGENYPPVPFTQALQDLGTDALFVVGQDDARQPAFIANSGTVYGVRDLNVYEAVIAARGHAFFDALNRLGPNRDQPTVLEANYAPDYHLLALSGTGYVVLPTEDAEPSGAGGHLVYQLESNAFTFESPLPPLRQADAVTQTFVAPTDDLDAVGVYAADDVPGGAIAITVRRADDGSLVGSNRVPLPNDDAKGSWVVATFPAVAASAGQTFEVSVGLDPNAAAGPGSVQLYADPGTLREGWIFSRDGQTGPGTLRLRLYRSINSDGLSPIWSDQSHTIYALENARPEAYIADGVESVADPAAALQALDSLHVPGADVVVEGAPDLTSQGGTANVVSSVPGDLTLDTSSASAGLVVINQGFADGGWQVDVDGQPQRDLHVNYLFQGVQVPAGVHRIHFHYWPASLTIGLVISGAVLVVILWLWLAPFGGDKPGRTG